VEVVVVVVEYLFNENRCQDTPATSSIKEETARIDKLKNEN